MSIFEYVYVSFSVVFFVTVVFWKFNLPVNEKGLKFRDWWKQRPKLKDEFK